MLLPALAKAKGKALGANCLNNQKQLGLGFVMFSDDNKESSPVISPARLKGDIIPSAGMGRGGFWRGAMRPKDGYSQGASAIQKKEEGAKAGVDGQSDVAVLPQRGGVSLPGRSTRQAGSQPEPLGLGELLQGEPDERRRMAGLECNGWLAAVFHKDD